MLRQPVAVNDSITVLSNSYRSMKRIYALLAAISVMFPSMGQTTQKFTASKLNEYGLVYTLPLTVVNVTVEVERSVSTPGEFYRYAKKYLNMEPVVKPSVSHTVKSVVVTTSGQADEQQRYIVQFKSGSSPFIMLTDSDFPVALNTEEVPQPSAVKLPSARAAEPTVLQTPAAAQAVTAEMLQSSSSAKRAELAAARIYELRQSRSDIISGSADQMPSDGQAMKLALDNLAAQEAALTAMFVGTEQTSTQVRTYAWTPGNDDESVVIARVSATDGLVDADDLSGDPLYLDFKVTAQAEMPRNDKGEEKRFPKGGLAYRIPGSADVSVTYAGEQVAEAQCEVAQLGVVFGLEPGLFTDKKAPAYATFDPATGAIITLGTKNP